MFDLTLQERLAGTLAGDYRQSGDDMMCAALRWIDEHPAEWVTIESRVREMVASGRKMSLRTLIDYEIVWGVEPVSVPHALTAPFQRLLMQRVPGYRECFKCAKSKVDE